MSTDAAQHQEVITIPVDPSPPLDDNPAPEGRFSEKDIENARKQEKDKLYGKLTDFESKFEQAQREIAALREAREAEVRAAEEKRAAAEAEARKKAEEEMSAKELLSQKEQEWQNRFSQFEQEREQERLIFQKEQEFNALRTYAQQRVQEALSNNEIAPELADFVSGNTKEEIDASLDFVRAKSEAIVQNIQQAQVQARAGMKGVSPTGYASTGPMDTNPGQQSFSPDDLKNMSMSEYAKIRGSLISAASQNNRGLYG